ncbi:hypothetical protein ABWK31_14395, partial [Bacillus sp. JJ353]
YILYETFLIVGTAHALGIPVPQFLLEIHEFVKNKLRRKR